MLAHRDEPGADLIGRERHARSPSGPEPMVSVAVSYTHLTLPTGDLV